MRVIIIMKAEDRERGRERERVCARARLCVREMVRTGERSESRNLKFAPLAVARMRVGALSLSFSRRGERLNDH